MNEKNENFDFILDGKPSGKRVTVKLFCYLYLPQAGHICVATGRTACVGVCCSFRQAVLQAAHRGRCSSSPAGVATADSVLAERAHQTGVSGVCVVRGEGLEADRGPNMIIVRPRVPHPQAVKAVDVDLGHGWLGILPPVLERPRPGLAVSPLFAELEL